MKAAGRRYGIARGSLCSGDVRFKVSSIDCRYDGVFGRRLEGQRGAAGRIRQIDDEHECSLWSL